MDGYPARELIPCILATTFGDVPTCEMANLLAALDQESKGKLSLRSIEKSRSFAALRMTI
jgi:hypothetical protein